MEGLWAPACPTPTHLVNQSMWLGHLSALFKKERKEMGKRIEFKPSFYRWQNRPTEVSSFSKVTHQLDGCAGTGA